MTQDPGPIQALLADPATAPLPPRSRAMVDYALKLTEAPASVRRSDIETLRAAGLDDRGILDVAQVVGYFAFVNRLADGLGVPLEKYWQDEPDP